MSKAAIAKKRIILPFAHLPYAWMFRAEIALALE
jgi:hypothetical protein